MITLDEKVVWAFDFFSKKTKNYTNYTYKLSKGEDVTLLKFINYIRTNIGEPSVGDEWLFNYFSFQFEYWREKKITYFKGGGIIELGWTIGQKAIDRWKKKSPYWNFYSKKGIIKEYNLSLIEFSNGINPPINNDFLSPTQELIRSKNKNTFFGFLNCLHFTSLYNEQSPTCIGCDFKIDCQKIKNK